MAGRAESEHPISVSGRPAGLYVSSGAHDDYLEISLPADLDPGSTALLGLQALADAGGELAVGFHAGSPLLVSITALHLDDGSAETLTPEERLTRILAALAGAAPELDFGDLLPEGLRPRDESPDPHQPLAVTTTAAPAQRPAFQPRQPGGAEQMARARELAARGNLHKALRILDELLRDSPGLFEAEELAAAIRTLDRREKRVRREPRSSQARLEVGFSYLRLGRNRDAAQALREAVRMEPDFYLAQLLLGISLHRLGDVLLAGSAYRRAGQLRPAERVPAELLSALEKGEPPFELAESTPVEPHPSARPSRPRLAWAG